MATDLLNGETTYTLEDEENSPYSLSDGQLRPVPNEPALTHRAEKTHYGLGEQSPGVPTIKQQLAAGQEDSFRQALSDQEQIEFYAQKRRMVEQIARQNGGMLTPDEEQIVMGLTQAEFKADPETVLERKFAKKYITDVLSANRFFREEDWTDDVIRELDVGENIVTQIDYFRNQLHDLEAEEKNQSTIGYIADVGAQLITGSVLTWWRMNMALKQRPGMPFLLGDTQAENIAYMWALPPEQRRTQFKAAIEYLKSKNLQDALYFARGMVSYPTSDQYIANAMSMADYGTAGSFAGKLFKGGKAVGKATEKAAEKSVLADELDLKRISENAEQTPYADAYRWQSPTGPYKPGEGPESFSGFQGPQRPTAQGELLGAPPEQGEFRFMSARDGGQPPWVSPPEPKPQIEDIVTAVGTYRDSQGKMRRARPRSSEYRDADGVYSITRVGEPEDIPAGSQIRGSQGRFVGRQPSRTDTAVQQDLPLQGGAGGQLTQHSFDFPAPTKPVQEARQLMADAVKAMEDPAPTVEKVLAATGRTEDAALISAAKETTKGRPITNLNELADVLPSFGAGARGFYQGARNLHRELTDRLINIAQTRSGKWMAALTSIGRGAYITAEALAVGRREAEAFLRKEYNRFSDSVINVRQTPADLHPMHIDTVTLQLGKPEGKLFRDEAEAYLYRDQIYELGDAAAVRRIGNDWFIELDRHVDITSDAVKAANLTPENSVSTNMFKMLTHRLLSADTILPTFQSEQRKIAQHAQQQLKRSISEELNASYGKLTKNEAKQLQNILEFNRDTPRPGRPEKRGMWYETAQEFEKEFVAKFGVTPRPEVVDAYFAYRQAWDMDWMLANLAVYRDKAILGVEQYQFTYGGKKSGWFEGKIHDEMPWNMGRSDFDAGIWVWDANKGSGKYYYKWDMTEAEKSAMDAMIKDQGYRVVQVFEPQNHPLKGIAKTQAGDNLKEQVHFVVTNSWERKPLNFKQVDYEPGGHVIYKKEWYVAGVNLQEGRGGKWTYLGDTPFLNVGTHAEAKKWADQINHGRQLLRDAKLDDLRAFVAAKLPYSYDEFVGMFEGPKAFLSKTVPVEIKQAGRRTVDTDSSIKKSYDNGNLVDGTRNPHDLSSLMDKSFLMERDHQLYTVLDGPKPTLVKAESLDPYTTMQRAFGQRFHNVWMNDYKIAAVQQWVQDAVNAGVMKPGEKTLSAHPMYFLYHPQYNPNAANRELVNAIEAERQHIVNFLGQQSELGKNMQWLQTKIQDSVYNYKGQGKVLDATLAATADPVSWLRATAFHSKLGFFNPAQFFVQSQALAHVVAVAGVKNGTIGMAGGTLARMLATNPNHIDTVAKIAAKFGWREADFKEMIQLLDRSGLYQVAGEAALRNDAFDMNLFRSKLGHIMFDIGPVFFNEGERLVRLSAFATAYREHKLANVGQRIGDRELSKIMNRSDLLSVNMTRASNAAWQSGMLSVPTQFFAFNARMIEQFVGKRLTVAEKLRAFATYSALYGLPIGIGVGTGIGGVWPVYDSFREEATKRGYKFTEAHEKILTDGVLQYAHYLLTGKEFNVAQRLGPANNTAIRDALFGDKHFLEVIMGASGSILGDIIGSAYPLAASVGSLFTGDDFPMVPEDFFRVARNISSVDMAVKQYHVFQYGKWLTKNNVTVGPAESVDALMAVMGLTSRDNADAFLQLKTVKNIDKAQDWYEKQAMENYRLALQALNRKDVDAYHAYHQRASQLIKWGDFSPQQANQIFDRAINNSQDLVDTAAFDLLRKSPQSTFNKQLDNYINRKR